MAELTRLKGSKNLIAAYGYKGDEVVHNDFDSKEPWDGMITKIKDEITGDYWVRVFKFYTCYTITDGHISERQISKYKIDDNWHLNPIFLTEDGRELPYVDIAAYLAGTPADNPVIFNSIPGVYPTRNLNLVTARTRVDNYNVLYKESTAHEYGLFNIWTNILEQDLFTIEYANSSATDILKGYAYSYYSSSAIMNGTTDDIASPTGISSPAVNENANGAMKYRNIENMIGNGHLIIDGLIINNGTPTVTINGVEHTSTLKCPTNSGQVHQLGYDSSTGLVMPITVSTEGSYKDAYSGNTSNNQVIVRGVNKDEGYGLFCYNFLTSTASDRFGVYRMIRRPL